MEGSSRRPPGYVFNKEFNKGIDTYFGRAFFEKKGMGRNIERKIKGSERKQRKIKGNERKQEENKRKRKENKRKRKETKGK